VFRVVDETMSPHIDQSKYSQLYTNMSADNYLETYSIRFGSVHFEENMSSVLKVFTCSRKEKKRCRIGSIIVMIEDAG
jgi:hypothetical protein